MTQGPTIDDVIRYRRDSGCPDCEAQLAAGPSADPACSPDCPLHCPLCGWEMVVPTDADALAYEPGSLIV
jgi:hypothetical protein